MKKVVIISRESYQTQSFMVAVQIAKEKGQMPYEVTLATHPKHLEVLDSFKPDFAILSPETIVWQAAIIKDCEDRGIPYIIAKGSHFGTRQVGKIFELVSV
jgi:hypothetical protein